MKAYTKVSPNIFSMFPFWACSSVKPISFIQMVPKTFGLYQMNPTTKEDNAATKMANKLNSIIVCFCVRESNIGILLSCWEKISSF